MSFVLILSFFMKTALADYLLILTPEQPFVITEFSILESIKQEGVVYRQSAWFQYLPLTSTVQAQSVGILDSNCYHLFSSIEKKSKSLNFIHYDCQDHEQMTITKVIKFIGNDDQQYSFEFNINIFEYENQWYYFEFIIFPYNNRFQIIIIKNEQILKNEILNVIPFKDQIIIQKIGDDLVIVDSKIVNISIGDKFATFPGKIMPIMNNNNIFDFASAAIKLVKQRKQCRCQRNSINNLIDSDYNYLNTSIYTSQFQNCDSLIFSGWFKINEIIQIDKEMTFQFIKLTSNMQNNQLQNQNISPLQLFYKLSQDLNEIIITSYSYTFPSVTLDFTNDPFLITQKFKITNNIQLWHLLYVKLVEDIWDLNIKFYEKQQVYEYKTQIIVKQFHQIFYKLYLGNLQQSTSNYLNIMGRNLYFFNCNQNFQQKNCHQSCGECDGPTYQDCLSCSIESQRIYLPEYKQCVCPYYTIDEDNKCMSYLDFDFKLISNVEYNEGCNYGQFELNGSCQQCPGLLNSQTIGCLECVMNPTDWQRSPFCETHLYLNQDGSTSELKKQYQMSRQYFTFNGINLELCSQCQESSLTNQNNINQDIAYKQESFKKFCFSESSLDQCYICNIQYCKVCVVLITKQVCLSCQDMHILNDDHCTMFSLGKIEENNCLSPYYISSTKECKLCTIENCIYCFEYVVDNLTLTTLQKNFQQFNGDDDIQVGCAMCKDGYVFDFRINLCVKQTPKIESCLRSYINNEGTEKCTLSTKSDFSISREIVNCEQFISNCLQCFLTVQSILRCIICKEGYTTSITEVNGQCIISQKPNQIISIQGNSYLKDAWMQRIQSFMGSFLPNSYFYPLSLQTYQIEEIAITCKEGYKLAKLRYCVQYCDSNCQECKLSSSKTEYFCYKCSLDYFKQNQRVQIEGICQTCSLLCAYCQSKSNDEIIQTSPNFIQTSGNQIFSKNCYIPTQDPNIIILPKQFIPIYCLDQSCQNNLLYVFQNQMCSEERFLLYYLLTNANIKYLNQVGVQKIIIQIEYPIATKQCNGGIQINSISLKENIFSLKKTTLIINGNAALFNKTSYNYLIENFDTIQISNFTMILDNSSLNFGNSMLKLIMKNIIFIGDQQQQERLLLNSNQLNNIDLVNITISNAFFSQSSFFHIDSLEFKEQLHIDTFLILNSTFINSNLFLIKNSQLSIYQHLS
ncbi:unnamed protein product [Paramecium primaurelia]|uniref:Transmembrane protein n=1 Tax=Paramecium primaurelia TaxID=5886 RepID=A0A8S1PAP1_PARPR|nr:unnamed protein product [Paramecium primaurelia]